MTLNSVVLPAPLGPMSPTTVPSRDVERRRPEARATPPKRERDVRGPRGAAVTARPADERRRRAAAERRSRRQPVRRLPAPPRRRRRAPCREQRVADQQRRPDDDQPEAADAAGHQLLVLDPHLVGVAHVVPGERDRREPGDDGQRSRPAVTSARASVDRSSMSTCAAPLLLRRRARRRPRSRPLKPGRVAGDVEDQRDRREVQRDGRRQDREQRAALDHERGDGDAAEPTGAGERGDHEVREPELERERLGVHLLHPHDVRPAGEPGEAAGDRVRQGAVAGDGDAGRRGGVGLGPDEQERPADRRAPSTPWRPATASRTASGEDRHERAAAASSSPNSDGHGPAGPPAGRRPSRWKKRNCPTAIPNGEGHERDLQPAGPQARRRPTMEPSSDADEHGDRQAEQRRQPGPAAELGDREGGQRR